METNNSTTILSTQGDVSTIQFTAEEMLAFEEQYGIKPLQLQTIMKTYGKGMNVYEFSLFLSKSKEYDLSVQRWEIRWYKDGKGNIVMFAGRDWFLTLAQRRSDYDSLSSSEVRENDEFVLDIANNKITHTFSTAERGEIVWAYAIARAKWRNQVIERVDFKTYNKWYNTWKTHPAEMIRKVAETHALKKQFGISWLYAAEEAQSMWFAIPGEDASDIVEAGNEFYNSMIEQIANADSTEVLDKIWKEISAQKRSKALWKKQLSELLVAWSKKRSEFDK